MIVDKQPKPTEEAVVVPPDPELTPIQVAVQSNPMIDAYHAVKAMLLSIPENPDDPDSPPLFKTIRLDNGQLARIKKDKLNEEYGVGFPAVFIHYINVYYNQGTMNISEGKGTMRIHYVLNRLNNSDDDGELEGLQIYKRIINVIESNKSKYPALTYRFQLQYWDQPLSFDDGLQPYWIDYQIWFRDYTGYVLKDYKDVYMTQPPFTQPSDQNEIANPDGLPNYKDSKTENAAGLIS